MKPLIKTRFGTIACLLLSTVACATVVYAQVASDLEKSFVRPADSARPWVYWFWLNSNITREGITADLEAMKRAGIGGVLIMEVDQGVPVGDASFAGPKWRELFKHVCTEANRLGIKVNMNNDAGWCGSGGPWITPELSMQKVVWTQTNVVGPTQFDAVLPQPKATAGYYREIAVFAFPTPTKRAMIGHLRGKSAEVRREIPLRSQFAELPAEAIISRSRMVDLSAKMGDDGGLAWEVPEGQWTLMRIGHTSTGANNSPAPASGRGLECDKLSKAAAEAHFNGLMGKLIADNKALTGEQKTLVATHIDSWEVGSQNWTARFREEFQRLRGYDPLPLLPAMAGRVVDSMEVSERFLWDMRQTISDLTVENYAGHMRELANRQGIRLSIEAYDGTCDDMTYAGRADEPMGEFWSYAPYSGREWCTEMTSAAHVYGRPIVGAEAFTATDAEKWVAHPGSLKAMGDWAFCEGINRFVFHRYALQPWPDRRPGMSMGPWGLHYERTQTWWEQSAAWHEYLARCQSVLQQGRFVADLCFLEPENSPQRFRSPVKSGRDRPGYNFDGCTPEVVLTRMKVKDGRLVLPDGMNYRLLVLSQVPTMTPQLLRKIKELVADGATVVGGPPVKSPSLSSYPKCDEQVKALAAELWGTGQAPAQVTERRYGQGRIFWGGEFRVKQEAASAAGNSLGSAKWIWRKEGNPAVAAPAGKRLFRRVVAVDAGSQIESARLVMTADNSFECWVNGRKAGSGDNFGQTYDMNVTALLKPGANLVAVAAVNATENPNPAGLIGALTIKYRAGRSQEVATDAAWEVATAAAEPWNTDAAAGGDWSAAMELGLPGMEPWGEIEESLEATDPTADVTLLCRLLAGMGVPPDFASQGRNAASSLRYIHRRIGGTEVFFVANGNAESVEAVCSFRVRSRRPELWWPENGRIERVAVYDESGECVRLPICLEPSGSVFVVFREQSEPERDRVISVTRNNEAILGTSWKQQTPQPDTNNAGLTNTTPRPTARGQAAALTLVRNSDGRIEARVAQAGSYVLTTADGQTRQFTVDAMPEPMELTGSWDVQFASGWGAPERITLEKLISWSEHSDAGVKYFSGAGTYRKRFTVPAELAGRNRQLVLDLGKVQVMAEVKLNGKDLGILWKSPFHADITAAVKTGENELEVKVVNLWVNRMIGDEQLPEDSDRNANGTLKAWPQWVQEGKSNPAGRYTFTSWRLWKKGDALLESGLLGPVTIRAAERVNVK